MTQTIVVSPEYAQVVILDPTAKVEVPRWERGVPFVASSTCILFGCMVDCDGETEITFGRADEVACDLRLTFDGILSTPGRRSAVENVWTDPIFESPTEGAETRVRIWSNRLICPDKVVIGFD